jgi:hypothetical protein
VKPQCRDFFFIFFFICGVIPLSACTTRAGLLGQCREGTGPRLQRAFEVLMSANGLTTSLERQNRMCFRRNLSNFLSSARGFLHAH